MYQHASGHFHNAPDYDPKTKKHYWIVSVAYHVAEPKRFVEQQEELFLDAENRVILTPPICLHCETLWDSRQDYRDCAGDPK